MNWDKTETPKRGARFITSTTGLQVIVVLIALALTATGAFAAGYLVGRPATGDRLKLLNEVWNLIDREFYYPKPSDTDRVYGAIQGMLATLKDSHTIFLPPAVASKDAAALAGETGGVGAVVTMNDANQVVIAEARRGWPAERAGAKAGDIILAVDGKSLNGLSLSQAVDLVKGPLGTQVELTLKRPNVAQPLVLKITRAQINVFGEMLDNNIAYISLDLFDQTSPNDVEKQLKDLLAQHPRALIFDLRGNGGGLLDSGLKIADLFLPKGLIATEKDVFGENLRFESKTGDIGEQIPMVVLVDGRTASASEIVSGALQDRKRAALIGQRTYGKGSVQSLHTLSDGSQLRVTQGAWYTPDETPIEHQGDQPGGLVPDVQVTLPDKPTPGVDPVMDAAIQYIKAHYWMF